MRKVTIRKINQNQPEENNILEQKNMHKVTIRTTKNKVKNPEELKRKIHRIQVTNLRKFYDEFIIGDDTPDAFIGRLVKGIKMVYYYKEHVNKDPKELAKQFNEYVDLDTFLDLYCNAHAYKLHVLGVKENMNIAAKKLYELLSYLTVENDIKSIKPKYCLGEIKENIIINTLNMYRNNERVKLQRMFAIKDGVMVDTAKFIEPNKELEGSIIMVEYKNNRFLSIPYRYYKKLAKIDNMKLQYKVILEDISDECEDDAFYFGMTTDAYSVKSILDIALTYENLWIAFEEYSYQVQQPINIKSETVDIVFKDGTSDEKLPYEDFISEYLPFIRL